MNEVELYIDRQEGNQREVMLFLHDLLLRQFQLHPKLSFKIPFYYGKKWILYLNPLKNGGIECCFTQGHLMQDDSGLLLAKGRKLIKGIEISDLESLPYEAIVSSLEQAIKIDKRYKK